MTDDLSLDRLSNGPKLPLLADKPDSSPSPDTFFKGSEEAHKAMLKKCDDKLLWFLLLCYTLSYLDRTNLSNVHKPMILDLGMSESQYGQAASIFFVPYVIAELPSNMILARVNAAKWIARIILMWGVIATALTLIPDFTTLMIIRFLLGLSEAGFFPGIIFYLTQWYSPPERARRLYWIYLGQPVAGVIGSLVAYPILNYMDNFLGFRGWRWLFFLEGIPTVIIGCFAWFYLPASPSAAAWLDPEEQVFLTSRARASNPSDKKKSTIVHADENKLGFVATIKHTFYTTFTTPILWLGLIINFCALFPVVAVSLYLPAIVTEMGVGELYGNLMSAIPFGFACVAMYFNSIHSDKTKERFWHIMVFNIVAFVGLGLVAIALQETHNVPFQIMSLSIAAIGFWGAKPPLLAWFTATLPGHLAASIAAITSVGNLAGVIAPQLMSTAREATGNYLLGAFLLMVVVCTYAVLLIVYRFLVLQQRQAQATEGTKLLIDSQTPNEVAYKKDRFIWLKIIIALLLLALFIIIIVIVAIPATKPAPGPVLASPIATIEQGQVEGVVTATSRSFLGIPYAQQPVGPLRFRQAQPAVPFNDVYNATTKKAGCMQVVDRRIYPDLVVSEECLYAYVYTPRVLPSENGGGLLPVFFWMHGGGFTSGAANVYNGVPLVEKEGVIVVAVNYRLGAFGFLSSPELAIEDEDFPSFGGVTGFADLIHALNWTRRNIKSFGGDPDKITVAGESAGSLAACALMVTSTVPTSWFRRVIMQSGACTGPWAPLTKDAGLFSSATYMADLNASNITDLRQLPAQALLAPRVQILPSLDDFLLPRMPAEEFARGTAKLHEDGQVLLGATSLDSLLGGAGPNASLPRTEEAFELGLSLYFDNDTVAKIHEVYPLNVTGVWDPATTWILMNAHVCVGCPTLLFAKDMVTSNASYPTFLYSFAFNPNSNPPGLALHAHELPFVFGFDFGPGFPWSQALSDSVQKYWGSFVRTGKPEGPQPWMQFDVNASNYLTITEPLQPTDSYLKPECEIWSQLTPQTRWEFCFQTKSFED